MQVPIQLAALGAAAVQLAGELADRWYPFLLPVSALKERTALLAEGAARMAPGRRLPQICPAIPLAVSSDPLIARQIAAWWIGFYLTSMGPLYRSTLRALGHGDMVAQVLAANPTPGTAEVPPGAQELLDELTVWGQPDQAQELLEHWYAAEADCPVLILPPHRSVAELDHMLESMRQIPDHPTAERQRRGGQSLRGRYVPEVR